MPPTKESMRGFILVVSLIAAVMVLVYFWLSDWAPAPGYFVLCITLAGVFLTVGDPLEEPEKLGWLLLAGILTLLEICVITPDTKRVFQVKFNVPTGHDYDDKMVGKTVLLADLYALNGGGPK